MNVRVETRSVNGMSIKRYYLDRVKRFELVMRFSSFTFSDMIPNNMKNPGYIRLVFDQDDKNYDYLLELQQYLGSLYPNEYKKARLVDEFNDKKYLVLKTPDMNGWVGNTDSRIMLSDLRHHDRIRIIIDVVGVDVYPKSSINMVNIVNWKLVNPFTDQKSCIENVDEKPEGYVEGVEQKTQ